MSTSGAAPPTGAQLVGATIAGRYKVESLLGTGGMGSVYMVHHTHMHKRFALKILNSQTAQVPELVARFEREAMATAQVEHPNITVAIDFGRADDGSFFLVLEYLEGQRLRDALAAGPLGISRAMHIARQVASALECSHELGIVHRDLKPENIMLVSRQGDHDFVKVLDFGLAKVATGMQVPGAGGPVQALTKLGTIFGTPKYMAPEQCVSGAIDGRTDLYALGLILYEMLAGVHPIAAHDTLRIITHQISTPTPRIKAVAPAAVIPASLEAVVMRLTEKEPENRYASATELLAALAGVATQEGILPPVPAPHVSSSRPRLTPSATATRDAVQTVASMDVVAEKGPPSASVAVAASASQVEPARALIPPRGQVGTAPPLASSNFAASKPTAKAGKEAARPSSFKARLPAALQNVPLPLLLLGPASLAGLLLALLLRSPEPPASDTAAAKPTAITATAAPAQAPQAQLDQALAAGLPALLGLAKQYPQDARVPGALASAYLARKEGIEALSWQQKAVALDEQSITDKDLAQAATLALSSPASAEAALSLLESGFGTRGVDALYELANRPGQNRTKPRLNLSLAKPEVRSHASPAALIALELRAADQCEAKRSLLPRAAQGGDQRTLELLKALTQTLNCGPMGLVDCWPCLRQDNALQNAIRAIEARLRTNR